jgi:hypothetical protein
LCTRAGYGGKPMAGEQGGEPERRIGSVLRSMVPGRRRVTLVVRQGISPQYPPGMGNGCQLFGRVKMLGRLGYVLSLAAGVLTVSGVQGARAVGGGERARPELLPSPPAHLPEGEGSEGESAAAISAKPSPRAGEPLPSPAAPLPSAGEGSSRGTAAMMPKVERPVMFDTPEADAICGALEVLPPDNAIRLLVEDWPVHPKSKAIVASVGAEKPLRYNTDMAFVLVPPDQKRVGVKIVEYPGESDPGPYPVPENVPIEGWPVDYRRQGSKLSLAEVQRRPEKYGGDRHAIVVDPVNRMLYEFFTFGRTPGGWAAGQASVFDLKSNRLRPEGWTSADAAGLPIFPTVIRYDELRRGMVEHAMRVTVRRTRRAYVHPATHFASRLTDENLPRMGERFRLRQDFDVSGFSPEVQAILKGLKKYGMLVADNGIEWAISCTPDPRIPVLHEELRKVKGASFEVVVPPGGRAGQGRSQKAEGRMEKAEWKR